METLGKSARAQSAKIKEQLKSALDESEVLQNTESEHVAVDESADRQLDHAILRVRMTVAARIEPVQEIVEARARERNFPRDHEPWTVRRLANRSPGDSGALLDLRHDGLHGSNLGHKVPLGKSWRSRTPGSIHVAMSPGHCQKQDEAHC